MKMQDGAYWPSPDEWREILGRELSEHLMADAEEIIRTGQHRERISTSMANRPNNRRTDSQ